MPYVERDSGTHAIKGLYANAQEGYAEEFLADDDAEVIAYRNPPAIVPDPVPSLYAVAQITIADGEISGFEIASKFAGGFVLDTGSYYIFFAETQPDANYLAKAYDGGLVRAFISPENKAEDYFIVTVTDFEGNPVDTPSLSLEIIRVN